MHSYARYGAIDTYFLLVNCPCASFIIFKLRKTHFMEFLGTSIIAISKKPLKLKKTVVRTWKCSFPGPVGRDPILFWHFWPHHRILWVEKHIWWVMVSNLSTTTMFWWGNIEKLMHGVSCQTLYLYILTEQVLRTLNRWAPKNAVPISSEPLHINAFSFLNQWLHPHRCFSILFVS